MYSNREAPQGVSIINVRTVPPLVVLSLMVLAAFVWVVGTPAARAAAGAASAASAPASAASAAASAPARAASAPPLSAFQPKTQAAAPAQSASAPMQADQKTYLVQRGDTLSQVFGSQWKQVCQVNHLRHCDQLEPGQELQLPEGITPKEVKAHSVQQASRKVVGAVRQASVTNAAGEILYRRVGTAPLNGCGQRDILAIAEEAWSVLGLSQDDRAWLRLNIDQKNGPRLGNAPQGIVRLVPDVRLEQVTFCRQGKVVSVGPMRTAWSKDEAVYGEKFVLPSGKMLVWMRNCFNWVPWVPEEQPQQPAPEPQQPAPEPEPQQPAPEPEPTQPPPAIPTATAPRSVCDFVDVAGALGQHHVPRQNGDKASSDFLTFVLDCQRRKQDDTGSWGIGFKLNYSDWQGTAGRGVGGYDGRNYLAQVSYREIDDDGRDWGVGVGVGQQHEQYHEAALAQQARYNLVGATWVYNDSRRLLAGETTDVKRQYYAGITIPTSASFTRTIFNQSVDASNMPRLKVGLQAGARWWVYQPENLPVAFFIEGGLFWQYPISASANVLAGIADKNHICGIGPGLDKDLMNGGDFVKAWGWWCDPFQGGRVARNEYRRHQFISDLEQAGGSMDQNGMIRLPPGLKNQ